MYVTRFELANCYTYGFDSQIHPIREHSLTDTSPWYYHTPHLDPGSDIPCYSCDQIDRSGNLET